MKWNSCCFIEDLTEPFFFFFRLLSFSATGMNAPGLSTIKLKWEVIPKRTTSASTWCWRTWTLDTVRYGVLDHDQTFGIYSFASQSRYINMVVPVVPSINKLVSHFGGYFGLWSSFDILSSFFSSFCWFYVQCGTYSVFNLSLRESMLFKGNTS